MSQELALPAPEWLEVANSYIELGSIPAVAHRLGVQPYLITDVLGRKDVRDYLNQVYLDMGYRNRDKLGAVMDTIIDAKLKEAQESEIYSSKDLAELIMMAHKMRMEEIKATATPEIKNQTNVQINGDNYGKLMEMLLSD